MINALIITMCKARFNDDLNVTFMTPTSGQYRFIITASYGR